MSKSAKGIVFTGTVKRAGPAAYIELTFDPKDAFGKVRAPVKVTLNGYSFRTTIATMGGPPCIGMRTSWRKAAGLEGGERLEVGVELDTEERVVTPPADLVKALEAAPPAWERWGELSYSHQREHAEAVEGAKKAGTRERRIASAVAMIRAMKPKKKR